MIRVMRCSLLPAALEAAPVLAKFSAGSKSRDFSVLLDSSKIGHHRCELT